MKKYVQNIDRLYAGQTADALVLNQVDTDFPVMVSPLKESDRMTIGEWFKGVSKLHKSFKLVDNYGNPIDVSFAERICDIFRNDQQTFDSIDECIADFNLLLQQRFKEFGHEELYMMDDTSKRIKPELTSKSVQKKYMHCLNGKEDGRVLTAEDGENIPSSRNTSQLNVLFPWKKTTNKSLYSSQLKVYDDYSIDDALEYSKNISMQGKVSYRKCLQAVARIGNNLYMMSPDIPIGDSVNGKLLFANSQVVVNDRNLTNQKGIIDNSLTFYQPSKICDLTYGNLAGDDTGFIKWFNQHNRKTVLTVTETYGTELSTIKYIGNCSYELELATYGPTGILLYGKKGDRQTVNLNSETYRQIKSGSIWDYDDGKYIIGNKNFISTGFMFNLYDNFVSGQDRKLRMTVPKDNDFNRLTFNFDWQIVMDNGFIGEMEVQLYVGEQPIVDGVFNASSKTDILSGSYELPIEDASLDGHDIDITVRIHYDVDYNKRSNQMDYRQTLELSGVEIRNIRTKNGVVEMTDDLTFGQYANESGISEEERLRRFDEFWQVSKHWREMSYQTVLESPLKNEIFSGIQYPNNYSTGDTYGDMFLTKSALDPNYNMNIQVKKLDRQKWRWVDDEDKAGVDVLRMVGREYINLLQCSEQLTLVYNPVDVIMDKNGIITVLPLPEDGEDSSSSSLSSLDSGKSTDTMVQDIYDGGKSVDVVTHEKIKGNVGHGDLKYQMVETIRNINRFESSIKHKPNVFSVVVENSNLVEDKSDSIKNDELEKYKKRLRDSVTQFVRNACKDVVPVHTQLFDVQFI